MNTNPAKTIKQSLFLVRTTDFPDLVSNLNLALMTKLSRL